MDGRFQTELATYVVIDELRARAGGSTYTATRESDGAPFILKTLAIADLTDWKHLELFERQAAALRSLDHPNIPAYVDSHFDEEAGVVVLVQEQVDGTNLREALSDGSTFSAEQTEAYLRQCLDVLGYLHACSPAVVHRDITPSNLVVDGDTLFVVDFGAVKVGVGESTSMTTVGTFGYMAPEQILGRASPQSDLFGAGMSFVALIAGCEPSHLPQDRTTGLVDTKRILANTTPAMRRTLLALTEPGIAARPRTATDAVALLDGEAPVSLQKPQPGERGILPGQRGGRVSPYRAPELLSDEEKAYLSQHTLRRFPAWAAVLLHFVTFGLSSIVHFGAQHDRMPTAMDNDPSTAKAIGFSFIPYFNFYWCIFNPLRLADRLNAQSRIRDDGDVVSRNLIFVCSVLGIVPYLNIIFGLPMWGVGVYKLQTAINQLADDAELEQLALLETNPLDV